MQRMKSSSSKIQFSRHYWFRCVLYQLCGWKELRTAHKRTLLATSVVQLCFVSTLWMQGIKNCLSKGQRLRYYWFGLVLYKLCGCKELRTGHQKDSACSNTGSMMCYISTFLMEIMKNCSSKGQYLRLY